MRTLNRRDVIALTLAGWTLPRAAFAQRVREITWDDLIPPGIPYGEIIGRGEVDEVNDRWKPEYDSNATLLNTKLHGAYIRMPGYVVPLEISGDGVSEFILVPYQGACIHTPPPPPNQLVLVRAITPWPIEKLHEAVWVEGKLTTQLMSTEVADTGYAMTADTIEVYEW